MTQKYHFPFGQELKKVAQSDRSPKKAFVLGVYASAVHARWIDNNGKQKVSALAVASEPEIFWTGENAGKIIAEIKIPEELGRLTTPSDKKLNGRSGRALDERYLAPLSFDRKSAWLCDMIPESRVNEHQRKAIEKHYSNDIINKFNLPQANIPGFDKSELNSTVRHKEILEELEASQADTLILLGDYPIYWFLRYHVRKNLKLSVFGDTGEAYGKEHDFTINGKVYKVIPLCHPRQANRMGSSNAKWGKLHDLWVMNKHHTQQGEP
jgi:uracil-DNA glycosylase